MDLRDKSPWAGSWLPGRGTHSLGLMEYLSSKNNQPKIEDVNNLLTDSYSPGRGVALYVISVIESRNHVDMDSVSHYLTLDDVTTTSDSVLKILFCQ